ncbi:hypothetical protein RchiOBHm_Chr5g0057011 [Rosa chinensis]|uniref:Uncharacterized protein n=1 Tax=Rosa chinensis TaxID=74649 RepID=A0A2P6QGS7_ROSCH|nr:hypothetical protein RchiOBHm_Chr5g0057011 [Rosa chinensis]
MVGLVYGDPRKVLLQHTICRDSSAPFNSLYCGDTGLTNVAKFEKSDPCIVMDPPNWTEANFAGLA